MCQEMTKNLFSLEHTHSPPAPVHTQLPERVQIHTPAPSLVSHRIPRGEQGEECRALGALAFYQEWQHESSLKVKPETSWLACGDGLINSTHIPSSFTPFPSYPYFTGILRLWCYYFCFCIQNVTKLLPPFAPSPPPLSSSRHIPFPLSSLFFLPLVVVRAHPKERETKPNEPKNYRWSWWEESWEGRRFGR